MTMASKYKDKDGGVLVSFSGVWISYLHTIAAYGQSCWAIFPSALARAHAQMFVD